MHIEHAFLSSLKTAIAERRISELKADLRYLLIVKSFKKNDFWHQKEMMMHKARGNKNSCEVSLNRAISFQQKEDKNKNVWLYGNTL